MNRKALSLIGIVAVIVAIIIVVVLNVASRSVTDESIAVRAVVLEFGEQLQRVSLSAPISVTQEAIRDNYGEYVSPELLEKWVQNPVQAPGRLTSSPWPARIAIGSVVKRSDGVYLVEGNVIEVTSQELAEGGIAAQYPVTIETQRRDGDWVIVNYERGPYGQ